MGFDNRIWYELFTKKIEKAENPYDEMN